MAKGKKRKAVKKKKAAKQESKVKQPKKQATKEKEKKLDIDFEKPVANQFVDFWQDAEPDNIYGMFGDPDASLGSFKGIYSGLPSFDRILSIKRDTNIFHLPLNKMIELSGSESSGKTTWCKYLICKFISLGGIASFVDFEHKYDPVWVRTIGRNMGLQEDDFKRILYIDPKHFEWFIIWLVKIMKKMIAVKQEARQKLADLEARKRLPDNAPQLAAMYLKTIEMPFLVVVDSIAGIYTEKEVAGEEENDKNIALLARLFSEKLKIIRRLIGRSSTLVIWVNQLRNKIATGGQRVFPGMMVTPGGNAVKQFCDSRIKSAKIGNLKRTRNKVERVYGTEHLFKTTKNQMGVPPFRDVVLRLLYDRGYDSFGSILEACADAGVIVKREGSGRYTIKTGNSQLSFDDNEIEDIQNKYPNLPQILLKQYQKSMEKVG